MPSLEHMFNGVDRLYVLKLILFHCVHYRCSKDVLKTVLKQVPWMYRMELI